MFSRAYKTSTLSPKPFRVFKFWSLVVIQGCMSGRGIGTGKHRHRQASVWGFPKLGVPAWEGGI